MMERYVELLEQVQGISQELHIGGKGGFGIKLSPLMTAISPAEVTEI